jgi:hypothetical protein
MDMTIKASNYGRRQKKTFPVTSLGTGELALSGAGIRSSVKSLAIGTFRSTEELFNYNSSSGSHDFTASISKDNSLSVGSTASADSFVPVLDTTSQHSGDHDDDLCSNDPYLGRRRQRPLKQEPQIPRCCVDTTADSVYAQTRYSSLLRAASLPTTLQVPPKARDFSRDDSSGVVLNFVPTPKKASKWEKEQLYWKTLVDTRQQNYGRLHQQTAQAYYSLGHSYLNADECKEAAAAFKLAYQIWKELEEPSHLSVGLGLDAYGLALLRSTKTTTTLLQAKSALDEAFSIRFHHLGVWHVDTVETFNKIASVHLHLGNYKDALSAYEEVYLVRKAIFGMDHPSVAISAHALANVHLKLSRHTEARRYYNIALEVYMKMRLSADHPTVASLLRDRSCLERVGMSSSGARN